MNQSAPQGPVAGLPEVFINCPYSEAYFDKYGYMIFAIACCGLFPVVAKDRENELNRLSVILDSISRTEYSVHDLSGCEGHLNMPLELGLAVMKDWRDGKSWRQTWAVLVSDRKKFSKELSDLNGYDPLVYDGEMPETIIAPLLRWFMKCRHIPDEITPKRISDLYPEFIEGIRSLREAWPPGSEPNCKITDIATHVASRIHGKGSIRPRQ